MENGQIADDPGLGGLFSRPVAGRGRSGCRTSKFKPAIALGEAGRKATLTKSAMNMHPLWSDLEQWLSSNCEELHGVLRAGASPNQIEALERSLGVTLPDDVKQFYLCHDGQTNLSPELFNGFKFLPLHEVASEWSVWQKLDADPIDYRLDDIPEPEIKPVYWSPGWVPFAADPCGNVQCIDLDPNQAGRSGQVITMWLVETSRALEASSLTEWFTTFVTRVRNNEFHYSEDQAAFVEIEDDD